MIKTTQVISNIVDNSDGTKTIYLSHPLSCNCSRCKTDARDGKLSSIKYALEELTNFDFSRLTDEALKIMEKKISDVQVELFFQKSEAK